MVSRRTLLVTGAAVVAAGGGLAATDRFDDVLRSGGARPRKQPDERDLARTTSARADLDALVELAGTEGAPDDVLEVLRTQADGLPVTKQTASRPGPLIEAVRAVAHDRATDAAEALSTDVAVVMASLCAGLTQVVQTLKANA